MGNNCCAKRLELDHERAHSVNYHEHDNEDLERYRIKSKHNVNEMLEELQQLWAKKQTVSFYRHLNILKAANQVEMKVKFPEMKRQRKKRKRELNVGGSKESQTVLSREILRSFDKTTQSSAIEKTHEFLKRNEVEKPDPSDMDPLQGSFE